MTAIAQLRYIRELDQFESTKILSALATRALIYDDAFAADEFRSRVARLAGKLEEAWGAGRPKPTETEASLLAAIIMLYRAVTAKFAPSPEAAESAPTSPEETPNGEPRPEPTDSVL